MTDADLKALLDKIQTVAILNAAMLYYMEDKTTRNESDRRKRAIDNARALFREIEKK